MKNGIQEWIPCVIFFKCKTKFRWKSPLGVGTTTKNTKFYYHSSTFLSACKIRCQRKNVITSGRWSKTQNGYQNLIYPLCLTPKCSPVFKGLNN